MGDHVCHGTTPVCSSSLSEEALEVDRRVLPHGFWYLAGVGVAQPAPGTQARRVAGVRGFRPGADGQGHRQSGYVKPLGQGLFELRVDHDAAELAQVFGADLSTRPELAELAAEGILLRAFCAFYGAKVVLLLSGLDKGADPKAQPRAIRAARKLLADWQAEQAGAKRRSRNR